MDHLPLVHGGHRLCPLALAAAGIDHPHRAVLPDRLIVNARAVNHGPHHVAAEVLLGYDPVRIPAQIGQHHHPAPALRTVEPGKVFEQVHVAIRPEGHDHNANLISADIELARRARRIDCHHDALEVRYAVIAELP